MTCIPFEFLSVGGIKIAWWHRRRPGSGLIDHSEFHAEFAEAKHVTTLVKIGDATNLNLFRVAISLHALAWVVQVLSLDGRGGKGKRREREMEDGKKRMGRRGRRREGEGE